MERFRAARYINCQQNVTTQRFLVVTVLYQHVLRDFKFKQYLAEEGVYDF